MSLRSSVTDLPVTLSAMALLQASIAALLRLLPQPASSSRHVAASNGLTLRIVPSCAHPCGIILIATREVAGADRGRRGSADDEYAAGRLPKPPSGGLDLRRLRLFLHQSAYRRQ